MTTLVWDQVGQRRYEAGVDRGVLYIPGQPAVPWNGLTSVSDSSGQETKSFYMDGIKYLETHSPNDFAGRIQAFTYPDELEELVGVSVFSPGVFIHDQKSKLFNLSYRTLVGNDIDGLDHGYKIHILYNLFAVQNDVQNGTLNESTSPQQFEWSISATPPMVYGAKPTAHISIHSRSVDPTLLQQLEDTLYGTTDTVPELPDLIDILNTVETFYA